MASSYGDIHLLIQSEDIIKRSDQERFESDDPPPTFMEVVVRLSDTGVNIARADSRVAVYLSRYALDCVWRDSDRPDLTVTANAGTSVSKRVYVTFYVGPRDRNIRLMKPLMTPTVSRDFDLVISRDNMVIGENATSPYATVQTGDTNNFFENQFTNQVGSFSDPGTLIGYATTQALTALRGSGVITVVMETDREDGYKSMFWWRKFLRGVSLWNVDTRQYDIVENGTEVVKYYQRMTSLTVNTAGGPFMPLTFFTFADPIRYSIAPHLSSASFINVISDPERFFWMASHRTGVTMSVQQCGLTGSRDLSTIVFSQLPTSASSDLDGHRVAVTNGTSVSTVTQSTSPVPLGVWRGSPLVSSATDLQGFSTAFEWEKGLSEAVLRVVNELPTVEDTTFHVIPRHSYVMMDVGTPWGSTTIGERSLQMDLGSETFINKFQLLYPRSMEDHQPTRVGLSVQKVYGGSNALQSTDVPRAVWFSGFQGVSPFGKQSSTDAANEYANLNTHSQSTNTLYGSCMDLVTVDPARAPSTHPVSGTPDAPVLANATLRAGRAGAVVRNSQPYGTEPTSNEALDSLRQELGPFVRGATYEDLVDPTVVKGIVSSGKVADWPTQFVNGHWFLDLRTFFFTPTCATTFTKGSTFYQNGPFLEPVTLTELLDTSIVKQVYPVGFTDNVPNPSLLRATFVSVYDFIMSQYSVYLTNGNVNNVTDTDTLQTEYVVKETFYPAPQYDQYDLESRTTYPNRTNVIRPNTATRAQKMCVPAYASGRYFGFTCGSTLDGISTRAVRGIVQTRPRLFAVRLGTQLFDFVSSGGRVVEAGVTQQARFLKTYTGGVLTGATVQASGQRYSRESYTTPDVVPYNGASSFLYFEDGGFVDRVETLLVEQGNALRQSLVAQNMAPSTQSRESVITASMSNDLTYDQFLFRVRAAEKTPLRRSAMFQLCLRSTST